MKAKGKGMKTHRKPGGKAMPATFKPTPKKSGLPAHITHSGHGMRSK